MDLLGDMTSKQLETMLTKAKGEIKRRENIQSATAEIKAVLKKYKISMRDIAPKAFSKNSNSKSLTKSSSERKPVKAKYANLNSDEKWSGRGRAPKWVMEICKNEGIDLKAFKEDERFAVGKTDSSV